jgi:two-component system, OmpR family, phosphate regulon sensor histidine kinase PhoR
VRRLLLVNALIFAVLAAAAALAYYGYSATSEQTSRERELALMQDLAEEKVQNIELLITEADTKLLQGVELDAMPDSELAMKKLRDTTGAAFVSVYVLDDQLKLIPGPLVTTRDPKEGIAYRDWFLERVVPSLQLPQLKVGKRGHFSPNLDGRPFLFSFMKRVSNGRTFYVVIEDDMAHLLLNVIPKFFAVSPKRLYQIIDERGEVVWGEPFVISEGESVNHPFIDTIDGWKLRVAQRDLGDQEAQERKRLVNSILIGGAVTVILGGLGVLAFAIRRERRLNDLKSEFISNVSHELKTPLSIISMFGEMLANGRTKSPEQANEYAEIIWRESVRLGRLIDNVLDFAKMERGMDVYEFSDDVDIAEVVERALELSNRRVAAAEMTLSWAAPIPEDLPLIRLDGNAFTLAVLNLVDNAIKYAVDGKKIEVLLRRDEDRILFSVRDFGPGIDPEEQERIFERFYRARSIRLKPIRGSGIGLALVQHIARAHGGDVTVASAPDQGSTFSIWLPIDGKN